MNNAVRSNTVEAAYLIAVLEGRGSNLSEGRTMTALVSKGVLDANWELTPAGRANAEALRAKRDAHRARRFGR